MTTLRRPTGYISNPPGGAVSAGYDPTDLLTTDPDYTTGAGDATEGSRSGGVITVPADTGGANNNISLLPKAEYWAVKDGNGTQLTTDEIVDISVRLTIDENNLLSPGDDVELVVFLVATSGTTPNVATDDVSWIACRFAQTSGPQNGDTIAFGGGNDRTALSEGGNTTLNRMLVVNFGTVNSLITRLDCWRKNSTAWQSNVAKAVNTGQSVTAGYNWYIGIAYGHRDTVASSATLTLSELVYNVSRLEAAA